LLLLPKKVRALRRATTRLRVRQPKALPPHQQRRRRTTTATTKATVPKRLRSPSPRARPTPARKQMGRR
ncbi:unnamed protein product, partial [Amoebophrya sp. A25]